MRVCIFFNNEEGKSLEVDWLEVDLSHTRHFLDWFDYGLVGQVGVSHAGDADFQRFRDVKARNIAHTAHTDGETAQETVTNNASGATNTRDDGGIGIISVDTNRSCSRTIDITL